VERDSLHTLLNLQLFRSPFQPRRYSAKLLRLSSLEIELTIRSRTSAEFLCRLAVSRESLRQLPFSPERKSRSAQLNVNGAHPEYVLPHLSELAPRQVVAAVGDRNLPGWCNSARKRGHFNCFPQMLSASGKRFKFDSINPRLA